MPESAQATKPGHGSAGISAMIAAHAYAKIVERLAHQALPAYVMYMDDSHIEGLPGFVGGGGDGEHRIVVDPALNQPLAAIGNINDSEDGSGAKVHLEQDYATFGNFVLPSRLQVDVNGRGIVFWLHVHADEVYSDFTFSRAQSK